MAASNQQKLAMVSTAVLLSEPAFALMHGGPLGVILGLGVGYGSYLFADEIDTAISKLRNNGGKGNTLPSPDAPQIEGTKKMGNIAYRILNGKSVRGEDVPEDDQQQEAEPETDKLPVQTLRGISLADNLLIPAGEIAGKAIFIAGIRRSGKSTLGVRLAEQMSRFNLPLFVPDLEGDWLSAAATTFKRGRILAHPSAARRYTDVPDFEAVTMENADVAGFNILDEGCQAVLDMASYPSVDEACAVVCKIIQGLFDWTEQYEDERVPCQVYLDEAQRFLPQSLDDSIIQDKLVRQSLLKAYMDIIAVGGKRGLSPVILTQRFAQVNKKIMAQSEIFFLLRQTNELDLKRCMEYVNRIVATEEQISTFKQGQGVYISATGEQGIYQYLPRESDGKRGATPTIEGAERYNRPRKTERAEASASYAQSSQEASQQAQDEPVTQYAQRAYTVLETGVREPESTTQATNENAFKRMTDEQVIRFETAYKLTSNIDRSLKEAGVNSQYRQHAREIIETQGLKKV